MPRAAQRPKFSHLATALHSFTPRSFTFLEANKDKFVTEGRATTRHALRICTAGDYSF
jgi:hypothetical protein